MKIHILGICGSFMGGIAMLAKQLGHDVAGCDANVYPPMSTQLESYGIRLIEGFAAEQLKYKPDLIIVGNAMKRGMPVIEAMLNDNLAYTSGPGWLSAAVLGQRHVLAVAGTHGKTTTTSLLSWVLEFAGLKPGFLVGGVPENFGVSARLGEEPYFVIEADEYDSAFFDKRSKFVHYHPRTLILNNLEFDHADIFADLAAIQTQFHHLVRIVPEQGCIIRPEHDANLQVVIDRGCWTPQVLIGEQGWSAISERDDNSQFSVFYQQELQTKVTWNLIGEHNVANALAVFAATQQIGIPADLTAQALASFKNVKRRLEEKGTINGITVYDDFAHHPTAIQLTLQGLRHKVGQQRIIAIIDLGSYTMRSGAHKNALLPAIAAADQVYFYKEHPDWHILGQTTVPWTEYADTNSLITDLKKQTQANDHIVVMSNRGFADILKAIEY